MIKGDIKIDDIGFEKMVCKNTTKKIDHYFFAAAEKSNLLQIWMTKNKLFLLSLSYFCDTWRRIDTKIVAKNGCTVLEYFSFSVRFNFFSIGGSFGGGIR